MTKPHNDNNKIFYSMEVPKYVDFIEQAICVYFNYY